MAWYAALGYVVFWFALIISIILYVAKRKWYPVMYLLSVSLYVFTAGFVIDVFDLTKDGILLVFAFSAVVMISLGAYLSKKFRD